MQTKVPTKAQPSRAFRTAKRPARSETAASTKNTAEPTLPVISWVQSRNTTATTAAASPTLTARPRARTRIGPSVFRAMKIAPWVRKSSSVVTPPSSA